MRIVHAADTYKPYVSGVTNYISLHKAELERLGHSVNVVTFGIRNDPFPDNGVVVSPGYRLKMGYGFGFRYSPSALQTLRQADVIHLHHPFITGQLILNALGQGKAPLIFTGHTRYDQFTSDYMPWMPVSWGQKILSTYLPGFCRKMSCVVSNSLSSVEGLRNCGVDVPLEIIPNGIDLQPFQSAKPDPALREKLLCEGEVVFTYVGRMAVEKNLPLLLQAFGLVLKEMTNARLLMVGNGPIAGQLAQEAQRLGIARQVTFTGQVAYSDLPAYFAIADAFVMTSVNDTHPLTVLEAMGAGLPVLTVRSPAYADTVREGQNGFMTENSAVAFGLQMLALARDEQLRRTFGEQSRRVVQEFSVERTTQRLVELYTRLLECRKLP